MTTPIYVDLHIVQDLPPSNINRDDNGTPKQAVYGGVPRLRVSSQSWKRAARKAMAATQALADQGVRTRRLHSLIATGLVESGVEEETAQAATAAALAQLKISPGKKGDQTAYLLFCRRGQLDDIVSALTSALAEEPDPTKAAATVDALGILGSGHSLDVALFGRMVADVTALNVDAATQVAHAISTHAAPTQFDYFTAVDDLQEKDEAGAGMIGTVEFNSATVYRFATVALHQLEENLADRRAAVEGVLSFVRAFATAMPSGHQNTFAARTRPALVAVVVREDQPVNLVSAFEEPVQGPGMLASSLVRLATEHREESVRWGDSPVLTAASYAATTGAGEELESAFGPSLPFEDLLKGLADGLERIRADQ